MYPDGVRLKCIGRAIEPLKLTHLVKIYEIYQVNEINIVDVLNAL